MPVACGSRAAFATNTTFSTIPSSTTKDTHARKASAVSGSPAIYEAVVVGAGPAGVTCVGNLLERKLSPILWVDDGFDGGRINRLYREVPSNTKVKLFIDFATAVSPFRKIVSGMSSRARWDEPSASDSIRQEDERSDNLQDLRQLDPDRGCKLCHAADMVLTLTEGLKKMPGVVAQKGRVAEAVLDENAPKSDWSLRIDTETPDQGEPTSVKARRLVLCTGASPSIPPLPVSIPGLQNLDLDMMLSPTRLSATLSPLGPTTVSVIGASHSAILVLMNLYNLASTSKPDLKVRWLTRHQLRYAVYMDGWILRDNTGLKGEAAAWAKTNLEPEPGSYESSDVRNYIEIIHYEAGTEEKSFARYLPGSDYVIQAIGYQNNPIPTLKTTNGKEIEPQFDHEKGSFTYVQQSDSGRIGGLVQLPGMYGAGIAFPERVKDPHGNVEMAVGFFKFMKFVKKVAPEWN